MKTIQEALEEEITRGNCKTCPKRYGKHFWNKGYCGVTEEKIGSGNEYCKLKEI
jgi:hypothetical protein